MKNPDVNSPMMSSLLDGERCSCSGMALFVVEESKRCAFEAVCGIVYTFLYLPANGSAPVPPGRLESTTKAQMHHQPERRIASSVGLTRCDATRIASSAAPWLRSASLECS